MLSLSHKNHHANTLSSLHSATSSGDDDDGKLNQQRHPRIMSWLITRSCFPSRLHNIIPESSIVKLELFFKKISRPLQFEYSTLRARYIRQVHILQAIGPIDDADADDDEKKEIRSDHWRSIFSPECTLFRISPLFSCSCYLPRGIHT